MRHRLFVILASFCALLATSASSYACGSKGHRIVAIVAEARKADASYGAIKIGDLLVTSPTPGYAMRSKPMRVGKQEMHRPGTLLGKALEALHDGKGDILFS